MTTEEDPPILFERRGPIGIVTLNRPKTLNAMNEGVADSLAEFARELDMDETARVMILTGNGKGFCSGMDISSMGTDPNEHRKPSMTWPRPRPDQQPVAILHNLNIPVIGAINGVAAGAGMSLAIGTDIRIASEHARFVPLFVKRGLQPDFGGGYVITKVLGAQRALEYFLTGDSISAEQALEWGLVSRVVPHEELMPTAMELAERLAKGPPAAMALIKRTVYRAESGTLEQDLEFGSFAQERLMRTEDFTEGWKSFVEKRPPNFTGR